MEVSKHEIETITYKTKVFEGFSCVTMTITDKDGNEQTIKLFANDLQKLTFVNTGIEVVEG